MSSHGVDFWAERWKSGQTAFHEGAPNALLEKHVARIESKTPLRVLVPLAGKSVDMSWLAGRGHDVVGIEAVPEAVHAFFADAGATPEEKRIGGHDAFVHDRVTLVCANVFDVTREELGAFDVVYDRAALVAIDPEERKRYVEVCAALASRTFLVTMAYDQTKAAGPPFSVDEAAVHELYAPRSIERLDTRSITASARLAASGVPALEESAYLVYGASTMSSGVRG